MEPKLVKYEKNGLYREVEAHSIDERELIRQGWVKNTPIPAPTRSKDNK